MTPLLCLLVVLSQAPGAPPSPAPAGGPTARPTGSPADRPTGAPAEHAPAVPLPDARAAALRQQVMLDRAGFSPGAIDGRMGDNTRRALEAYTRNGGKTAARVDPLARYAVTPADLAAPFTPEIPDDLMAQAELPSLGYRNVVELLAERFHTTPEFLRELNPGAAFTEGESLLVPNVEPFMPPVEPEEKSAGGAAQQPGGAAKQPAAGAGQPDLVVRVSKATSSLSLEDAAGRTIFYAPVTTGSEHDPLPLGEWKVNGVERRPQFHYNPDLFWDAEPSHAKATLPAGPNNPVGLVWIDISKEHYGLHGTPAPETVGHVASHGCVRLTNWDALKLASLVKPGTRVLFVE